MHTITIYIPTIYSGAIKDAKLLFASLVGRYQAMSVAEGRYSDGALVEEHAVIITSDTDSLCFRQDVLDFARSIPARVAVDNEEIS